MAHSLIYATSIFLPFKDPYFEGSWYGNDTIPRTIIDINKIIFYADKNGVLRDKIQRKMFILVDAIIAGEGEGPLKPSPKKCGLIVGGFNPVAVDLVCCRIMGFDHMKIPVFKYALNAKKYRLFNGKPEEIKILSEKCNHFNDLNRTFRLGFTPPMGWRRHIELELK
jgi:hypothetical protein